MLSLICVLETMMSRKFLCDCDSAFFPFMLFQTCNTEEDTCCLCAFVSAQWLKANVTLNWTALKCFHCCHESMFLRLSCGINEIYYSGILIETRYFVYWCKPHCCSARHSCVLLLLCSGGLLWCSGQLLTGPSEKSRPLSSGASCGARLWNRCLSCQILKCIGGQDLLNDTMWSFSLEISAGGVKTR